MSEIYKKVFPGWMQEFKRFQTLKSQFYLFGNVYDCYYFPVNYHTAKDTQDLKWARFNDLKLLLKLYLKNEGYEIISYYDVIDGIDVESNTSADINKDNIVKYLIENGANIHGDNDYALCSAAENDHLDIVKYLHENGANIHADNDYALRLSAENGYLEIVKYLVENGANIHATDDYVLRWSAEKGHLEMVKYFVENGANINAENDYAIRYSARNGHLMRRRATCCWKVKTPGQANSFA